MTKYRIHPIKIYSLINKVKLKDMAASLKISRFYLSQIIGWARYPGDDLASRIEKFTNGEVSAKSIVRPFKYKRIVKQ